MKKLLTIIVTYAVLTSAYAITDVYKTKLHLRIPRVFNNTQSLGYRKYQWQTIKGITYVTYADKNEQPTFHFSPFTNVTHTINDSYVIYDVSYEQCRWNYIGDNKTRLFKTPSVMLSLVMDPSYKIWQIPTEDNSLYVIMGGSGTVQHSYDGIFWPKNIKGFASGTIGCGCTEYGHVSPTRMIGKFGPLINDVDDVAAIYGQWRMTYLKTIK